MQVLGDISYPVYVVHYPLMYLHFYAWLIENKLYTLGENLVCSCGCFLFWSVIWLACV